MKFYKIEEPIYIRDFLISLANRIHPELVMPLDEFEFLFRLTEEKRDEFCKATMKKDISRPLYVTLHMKSENSDACPHQIDYKSINWNDVVKVEISGSTCDAWDNRLKNSYQYVSVVLVTKAS